MIKKKKIAGLIEEHLSGTEFFLVEMHIGTDNQILVLIDGDNGVTVSECISLSRYIETNLDREEEDFGLEVSSYGLTNPLVLLRQYKKNIGRELEVTLKDNKIVTGKLTKVDNDVITLYYIKKNRTGTKIIEEKSYIYPLSEIAKAMVKINI